MRNKALDRIRKSTSKYISVLQAADVLGFAYINLISKIRSGQEVGFYYEYKSDQNCYIPRTEFVRSVESWKWTAENIEMLKESFITVTQAANAIGCTDKALRNDMKVGKDIGFTYRQIGGIWRIHKQSFLNFIEGKEDKKTVDNQNED